MVNNNKNSEFALAVANLAAAAMTSNPSLSMKEAVAMARNNLLGTSLTEKQIQESVLPEKIKCFEDGTWHIMLRRYLKRKFNMTPSQYKQKWGLPDDYPLVAPNYTKKRSKIAKKTGLGKK